MNNSADANGAVIAAGKVRGTAADNTALALEAQASR
jgi:hypothetical protein